MRNSRRMIGMLLLAIAAAGFGGCQTQSALTPMKPLETQVYWELVDDVPATTTAPATTRAAQKDWDTSNSAYGVYGAWALKDAGVEIPEGYWKKQDAAWPTTQGAATQISAAGLASLYLANELATSTAPALSDEQIEKGLAWLNANTQPATLTAPATSTAPSTEPASQAATAEAPAEPIHAPQIFIGEEPPPAPPGKKYVRRERIVDPNQSTRYAYRTNYDYLYQHAMQTVADMGYFIDRTDYRQGIIISFPKPAAQIVEPWRPDFASGTAGAESTINSQRRTIRVTIQKAPNTAFYEVGVQVQVDRESNPRGTLAGAVTFRDLGTAFGRSPVSLGSDNTGVRNIPEDAAAASQPAKSREELKPSWYPIGRESGLEHKILDAIFKGL